MYEIGFVILTWNSERYISKCLNSIARILNSNNDKKLIIHAIVVDNGSVDETKTEVKSCETKLNSLAFSIHLIELQKNLGTTKPRNIGIRQLFSNYPDTNYLCILDSDTEVNSNAILSLVKVLESDPTIGIIGPRLHDAKGEYQDSGRNTPTFSEKFLKVIPTASAKEKALQLQNAIPAEGNGIVNVGYLMSACWMMKKSIYEKLGPLDEKIFYAPEDADYCMTCWDKGLKVVYDYDCEILHHWQRLSRKKLISKHNWEHIKGLNYLFRKHGHTWKPYEV